MWRGIWLLKQTGWKLRPDFVLWIAPQSLRMGLRHVLPRISFFCPILQRRDSFRFRLGGLFWWRTRLGCLYVSFRVTETRHPCGTRRMKYVQFDAPLGKYGAALH